MMAMNNLLLFWEWQGDGYLFVFSSDISDGKTIGFASQLCLLVKALEMSLEAQFMEDFVSGLKNLDASFYVLNMNYSWYVHILSKIQLLLMLAFQVKISYFYTLFFFPLQQSRTQDLTISSLQLSFLHQQFLIVF